MGGHTGRGGQEAAAGEHDRENKGLGEPGLKREELGQNGKGTSSIGAVSIMNWNSSLTHEAVYLMK